MKIKQTKKFNQKKFLKDVKEVQKVVKGLRPKKDDNEKIKQDLLKSLLLKVGDKKVSESLEEIKKAFDILEKEIK